MRRIRSKQRLARELAKIARSIRDTADVLSKDNHFDSISVAPEPCADVCAQLFTVQKFIVYLAGHHQLLGAERIDSIFRSNRLFRLLIERENPGYRDALLKIESVFVASDVIEIFSHVSFDTFFDAITEFTELFLAAYDPTTRKSRGAYYTPRVLADFLIGSVDDALCREFSFRDGLAEKTSRAQLFQLSGNEGSPLLQDGDAPFVAILDPAAGTGVFMLSAIRHIHRRLVDKWQSEGDNADRVSQRWNHFVRNRLSDVVHGYELSPATAAIANVLIQIQLEFMGCTFDRPHPDFVCVANPLDREAVGQPFLIGPEIRAEPRRFSIIVGNPPFSAVSANNGSWIDGLLRGRLADGRRVSGYYDVDGEPLAERKIWLQDDYVKFIRYAQWLIEESSAGVLAFVTNHGYLDNPTFRGMRQSLLSTFSHIHITDLHGSLKKHESRIHGVPDENVFPIEQGVAVGLFAKTPGNSQKTSVRHGELWGRSTEKLSTLATSTTRELAHEKIVPVSPNYFFYPRDDSLQQEYERGFLLLDVMPMYSSAVVTARDRFVVGLDRNELIERIRIFRDDSVHDNEIRSRFFRNSRSTKYPPGDTRGWKLEEARRRVAEDPLWKERLQPCQYRAFDRRWIYWANWMIDWPRAEVSRQVIGRQNWLLVARRQMLRSQSCNYFWVSDMITVDGVIRSDNRGNESLFPLYLYEDNDTTAQNPRANFSSEFIRRVREVTNLEWSDSFRRDRQDTFDPSDLFQFIYAVFFSPSYRQRYAEFLRVEFPRVFIPQQVKLFQQLARWGRELIDLHCLTTPRCPSLLRFHGTAGKAIISSTFPRFQSGRVYINEDQWFETIRDEQWEFRAGVHQVCRKWLRDRRGRCLSVSDIETYLHIVTSVKETMRLMNEIDQCIEDSGGWPEAFTGKGPSVA